MLTKQAFARRDEIPVLSTLASLLWMEDHPGADRQRQLGVACSIFSGGHYSHIRCDVGKVPLQFQNTPATNVLPLV